MPYCLPSQNLHITGHLVPVMLNFLLNWTIFYWTKKRTIKISKIKSLNTTIWGHLGFSVVIKYKMNALHVIATFFRWVPIGSRLPPFF